MIHSQMQVISYRYDSPAVTAFVRYGLCADCLYVKKKLTMNVYGICVTKQMQSKKG